MDDATTTDDATVLAELAAREPLFHRTELGTSRDWFDNETAEDFWEVGASGRVYGREDVWSVLEQRYAADEPDDWHTDDHRVRHLAGQAYLFTYRLVQGDRVTRRATVWERMPSGWRIVYHQGTEVAAP